jgi:hypothetical protein
MSIVRIGMSEDDKFGAGYDAIFGSPEKAKKTEAKPAKKPAKAAKKGAPKKGNKKK